MSKLGSFLKKERERQGISIQEIGLSLKISTRVLTAIEEGDKANLPARTFLRGFVRSYALHLHLDPQQALHLFNEEFGLPPVPEITSGPGADEPAEEKPTPKPPPAPKTPSTSKTPPAPKSAAPEKPRREDAPSPTKARPLPGPSLFENKILTAGISIFLLIAVVGVIKTVNKYQRERVAPVTAVVVPTPEEPATPTPEAPTPDPASSPLDAAAGVPATPPPASSTPENAATPTPPMDTGAAPTPEPTQTPAAPTPAAPTAVATPAVPPAAAITPSPELEAPPAAKSVTPVKALRTFEFLSPLTKAPEAPLSDEQISLQRYLVRPTPTPEPTAEPTPAPEPTVAPTPEAPAEDTRSSPPPAPPATPKAEATPSPVPTATPTPTPTPKATPSPTPSAPPPAAETPDAATSATGQSIEVILEAKADVKIEFQAGTQASRSKSLAAGEIYTLKARDTLSLTLDNGGAATVYVNGLDRGRAPEGKPLTLKLPEPQ